MHKDRGTYSWKDLSTLSVHTAAVYILFHSFVRCTVIVLWLWQCHEYHYYLDCLRKGYQCITCFSRLLYIYYQAYLKD